MNVLLERQQPIGGRTEVREHRVGADEPIEAVPYLPQCRRYLEEVAHRDLASEEGRSEHDKREHPTGNEVERAEEAQSLLVQHQLPKHTAYPFESRAENVD